jgi:hypothetical protein
VESTERSDNANREEESRGQLENEKVTHIAVEEEGRRLAEEQTRLLEEETQGAAAEQER